VTTMQWMFYNASAFNQPIGKWNTAAVTNMRSMFYGASAFNQPLCWKKLPATDRIGMFSWSATPGFAAEATSGHCAFASNELVFAALALTINLAVAALAAIALQVWAIDKTGRRATSVAPANVQSEYPVGQPGSNNASVRQRLAAIEQPQAAATQPKATSLINAPTSPIEAQTDGPSTGKPTSALSDEPSDEPSNAPSSNAPSNARETVTTQPTSAKAPTSQVKAPTSPIAPAATQLRAAVEQPQAATDDSAAAAAREASPDDTRLGGSRGILGVTWAELRVALWLTLTCAVTAALVAVPAGAVYFFGEESLASLGFSDTYAFRDTARMQRREPYTVEFDTGGSSRTALWASIVLRSTWKVTISQFCLPVCSVAYLGASLKVCCVVLGSAILAFMVSSAAAVVSQNDTFLVYSPALSNALLVVALKLICPRNSAIHRHVLKQALVVSMGNVLVANVIPEKTVRTRTSHSIRHAELQWNTDLTLPVHRTWFASCKRLFCSTCTRRRAGA
jgi:surface protein